MYIQKFKGNVKIAVAEVAGTYKVLTVLHTLILRTTLRDQYNDHHCHVTEETETEEQRN